MKILTTERFVVVQSDGSLKRTKSGDVDFLSREEDASPLKGGERVINVRDLRVTVIDPGFYGDNIVDWLLYLESRGVQLNWQDILNAKELTLHLRFQTRASLIPGKSTATLTVENKNFELSQRDVDRFIGGGH